MADFTQIGVAPELGWVDKRRAQTQTNTNPIGTNASFEDVASMDARLTAISATAYSASRLRVMTLNDKIYALRVHDESAGI